MKTIRLGTRGSQLALWQAYWVKSQLEERGCRAEPVIISTTGDRQLTGPLAQLGTTGVFTKEIQSALLAGEIDVAVHSLKDLPTTPISGIHLAAVPRREDPRDVLVCREYLSLDELPPGSIIGTGSLRRKTQLLRFLAEKAVDVRDVRGNIQTRLARLDSGEYQALILAAAGLIRLRQNDRIRQYLEPPHFLPAPGQGALGLETRCEDSETIKAISLLDDFKTHLAVVAERTLLATLEGGCSAPIGAWGIFDDNNLTLHAKLLSPVEEEWGVGSVIDRSDCLPLTALTGDLTHDLEKVASLGQVIAESMLQNGGDKIIAQCAR